MAHVNRPGQFDEQVTVTFRDGRERAVVLPSEMTEHMAAIGKVRLGG